MDFYTRSYAFDARADNGDGLTLEGYAAVFNSPTDIRDWDGEYEESIIPGAFARSISKRTPVLQFDHGQHPLVGSIPLGAIEELREDDHGLFVRARLHDNWLVEPVRDAIRSGAVDGMSFRFQVRSDEWSSDRSKRTIRQVELFELGPVVFPAYADTTVGVRSELAAALTDPTMRADIARILIGGVPDPVAAGSEDADDAERGHASATDLPTTEATDPDHASGTPDLSIVRNRVLALQGVL